jgi:putative ABC transport system permease protein
MKSRLRLADLLPVSTVGLQTRPARAALSVLGVAIGIAAMVSVLGITRSSQADLLARIDRLGTNLLTVSSGRTLDGADTRLPAAAGTAAARTDGVLAAASTAELASVRVSRRTRLGMRLPHGSHTGEPRRWPLRTCL